METLYITQENCSVRRESGHLKLTRSGETLATVPLVGVKTVVVFDTVNITTPALDLLMANGVDIIFQSKWGKVKGRVAAANGSGAITKLAQYSAFMDAKRRLDIAKSIVAAKIGNQLAVVRKYKYHDTNKDFDANLSRMADFKAKLNAAERIEEVMGIEGIAAKHYWACFQQLLKKPIFTRRDYRPSPDYVNALLNLGYAFLQNEIATCLLAVNFDLEIGFLHSIHYGRNSLSLDLMEEFRAVFIDAWVLALLNKNQLKEDHFYVDSGDWRLTEEGFRKFCELFHQRVESWRGEFREQARKLKDSIIKGATYEPYSE